MRPVFETCQPRPEVLSGEPKEEIFAARLKDVIDGTAEDIYQAPARFFDNTYPTEGLSLLLNEALGRLTGLQPTNNPVIRLETAFGGGKTHNLIALYHAANGNTTPEMMQGIVDATLLPRPGQVRAASTDRRSRGARPGGVLEHRTRRRPLAQCGRSPVGCAAGQRAQGH